jgi:hypothetical protein
LQDFIIVRLTAAFAALIISAISTPIMALDLDVRSSAANTLDFSLLLEHSTLDLENNGKVIETNLERVGVLTIDVPAEGPHFGLALGYAFSDFTTNNRYLSVDMDGFYIGLFVRQFVYESPYLSLMLQGQYVYQDVSGTDRDENTSSLRWDEYSVAVTASLAVTPAFHIYAAPVYGDVHATYRERSAVIQTVKLDSNNRQGFFAGLRYQLNRSESVSAQYTNAAFQGVVLRFRRLF